MASPRRLAYRDRFVWELEQVVSALFDDCDGFTDRFVFPDMSTRVPLVMYLSQEEWTTLYSAVLTGADLSYPNTSHDVENLFLQTVNCPMNQLCEAIADCILNDSAVFDALNQFMAQNQLTGGVGDPYAPLSEEITGQNLLPAGYTCTDDKAFGMARAVVEAINDATTEVLQAIEILTNPVEIANELGDNMPGLGALTSAGDVASWIQNSAQEAYELAWSDVIRDELACELWCDFKLGCSLTFDSIWNVYLSKSGASPPSSVLLTDWLAWLIALPFTSALSTVSTISLLGLLAMRYGGSFGDFSLGIRSIETVIKLAEDDSSPDWSTVCDPCVLTWCYEWFNGTDANWVGRSDPGCPTILSPTRVTGCAPSPGTAQFALATLTFPSPTEITLIQVEAEMMASRPSGTDRCQIFVGPALVYDVAQQDGVTLHQPAGVWPGATTVTVYFWSANDDAGPSPTPDGAYTYLNWVRITGNGANPMGADNC